MFPDFVLSIVYSKIIRIYTLLKDQCFGSEGFEKNVQLSLIGK